MTKKLSDLTVEEAEQQRKKSAAYWKRYYAVNADKLRARATEYGKQQRLESSEKAKAQDRAKYVRNIESAMFQGARLRARKKGLPFEISVEDIRRAVPKDRCCPITRQPFEVGVGKAVPQSMSLDRVNPQLGYVPGNIAVISFLANTMKNNCTDPSLFRRWAAFLRSHSPNAS